ncbi:hypothetical protein AK812_SmicGene44040 [Symbiodinium microadriaticum]|uniref:Uncharacterized protein n=1 Tax=Symbiodinium microadriaticum TaxID=2951 RepID=A0A1Q9BZH0_SYMMI|nr:hypothetical protein AK812_SmicGene44040 [Symbiodinium microadriaticum]
MILPFTEELEGAQNDTLFERLMLDVLEDSLGGTSAVFAEPGIGKSVASVLAAQKTNASQSRLMVVLQGAFEESLETFFRVQKASQAPKVARSMFKMLADHGVRLQIVFDNTFDNEVPEQSKAPMRDLTRFAFAHGHHLIVICQAREGAESVDDLNGVRTRIAAQQNGRCAEEFRWSEKLAENYLNATVMSELKARGHGLERYADVMREWLNGTKVRDQFGGWNPTIMSLYVRRMCTLGEDVPREARAAPRGESTSAVWARQLQKHSADVKNGRQAGAWQRIKDESKDLRQAKLLRLFAAKGSLKGAIYSCPSFCTATPRLDQACYRNGSVCSVSDEGGSSSITDVFCAAALLDFQAVQVSNFGSGAAVDETADHMRKGDHFLLDLTVTGRCVNFNFATTNLRGGAGICELIVFDGPHDVLQVLKFMPLLRVMAKRSRPFLFLDDVGCVAAMCHHSTLAWRFLLWLGMVSPISCRVALEHAAGEMGACLGRFQWGQVVRCQTFDARCVARTLGMAEQLQWEHWARCCLEPSAQVNPDAYLVHIQI